MRVAIYYAPAPGHPLADAAARWLGRDAFAGSDVAIERSPGLADDLLDALVAEPRRYGFHATLKAPFRLADARTIDELSAALARFCAARAPVPLGSLAIAAISDFVALVPAVDDPVLRLLAADVVRDFEAFRAPLTGDEERRRLAEGLSPRQQANLRKFGYPHVFEDFRFHLTLASRVPEDRRSLVISMLHDRFKSHLGSTPLVDSLALFVEPEPGAAFVAADRFAFGS